LPVLFPSDSEAKQVPPDADEVDLLARGIVTAVQPSTGLTTLQDLLLQAVFESMTGFPIYCAEVEPIGHEEFAQGLALRNREFRTRIVQIMLLGEMVLMPLPDEVSERVERFAAELGVEEGMIEVTRDFAKGSLGLALTDFERNGYTADWNPDRCDVLHTSAKLHQAWDPDTCDPDLAARWAALEKCPPGSLGLQVTKFYRSRGFSYPGLPGSAPPYLAQHDWVHILADFGTTVESEIEVFGLIGRAIPDFKGFSLLAMVIGLFETGFIESGAGLFQADKGHLSKQGMPARLGDAMRRGALCGVDLMGIDWFLHADASVEEARRELKMTPKADLAVRAGSVGPWEKGGISPYQLRSGQRLAEEEGRVYESFGAALA
jgi:hypothetical protein